MKKNHLSLITVLSLALFVSSCASYSNAGSGAIIGGQFGHVIGSAIGGLSGGWRGSDMGALIGTVGGAVAGAAIGSAVDKSQEQKYRQQAEERRHTQRVRRTLEEAPMETREAPLEIRNASIVESHRDGVLTRGEVCTVRFEIYNTSDWPIYDVRPLVGDVTGNKHVKISPNLHIESIDAHQGVRYSASIQADSSLKDGVIQVMIGVAQGRNEVVSQTQYFNVPTAKKHD